MENLKQKTQQVIDGYLNPLEFYIELKKIEKQLKESFDIVQSLAIIEADKFNGKSFEFKGAIIEKKNGASTWNYENVNAFLQCKEKLNYIQKVSQLGGGIDPETGEEIGKAIKVEGKSTISVRLKNN